ncbi:MAG: OmpH family outer membrane protein [Verrucomicrobiales bacterium]|nr:OmpH family outer membrane protein [Verrucomicrobiales bacterium]MED5585336.1 OmpH family outer membrane protein [Verrucomicrobiota bacterium]
MIHLKFVAAFAVLAFLMPAAGAQGMKVGIVDMSRVFAEYYKTKDAEQDVNDQKELAKKELEQRNVQYKALIEKYQLLAKQIKDPAITAELRAQKQEEAKAIASEARSLEREKKEFADRRQRMLLTEVDRARKAIIEEIQDLVKATAKQRNYDIVFDKSGVGDRGIPFLLHSKDAVDFSKAIIEQLNKNAPASKPAE